MAILKIYKTNLDPTRNMVLDNIEDYLANVAQEVYVDSNFQFIRPALQQTIKINAKTFYNDISLIKIANFLSITEKATNNEDAEIVTYYYFIMGAEWVADGTCRLTIALDTLNTWWDDIKSNLTDKTHITREHKDRLGKKEAQTFETPIDYQGNLIKSSNTYYYMMVSFQDDSWAGATTVELARLTTNRWDLEEMGTFTDEDMNFDSSTGTLSFKLVYTPNTPTIISNLGITLRGAVDVLFNAFYYRKIDKFSEGLQPIVFGENKGTIEGDNNKWYLIYGAPKGNDGQVVNSYLQLCPKYPVNVYVPGTQQLTSSTFNDDGFYYIVPEYTSEYKLWMTIISPYGTEYEVVTGKEFPFIVKGRTIIQIQRTSTQLRIRKGYREQNDANPNVLWETEWESCPSLTIQNTQDVTFHYSPTSVNNINTILNGSQVTIAVAGSYHDIYSIDSLTRTSSNLVKVIELPYSILPGAVTNDWTYDSETHFLQSKVNNELQNTITANYNPFNELKVNISNISKNDEHNKIYESKLYHSDFYQPKFVYDSFTKTFALERENISTEALNLPLKINFKATNTINSRFLFDFTQYDTDGQALEDYENILIVNRNNELPVYNDEYLNYLRTGYNYDMKAKNAQIGSAVGSAGLSVAGSAASIAIAATIGGTSAGGIAGMVVGAAVGVVGAIVSIASQSQLQANSIQQKEAQYANQAMSVRGSDDVDLLNYYSNNKAKMMLYKPSEQMTNALYNMFRLTGYATDNYDIPDFDSRIWYNFVQCEPVFNNNNSKVYNDFIDDIKARFQMGVTVFHEDTNNTAWDITQEKENYETFLFN